MTLEQVIELAREQSQSAQRAATLRENRYWYYRTYLSDYKPQLSLQGNLPDFDRRFRPVTQQDGTIEFRPVFQNNSSLELNLSQSIGSLGTRIFANSEVQRFDDFDRNRTSYNAIPFSIGFIQPIFDFNPLKWNRKIEPLRFEESKKEYYESLENISVQATRYFFNLLLAQINYEMAENNLANNDTIYKIAEGRYNLGKIAENELLQLQLNVMNSRQALAQAELDLQTNSYRLRSYIGIPGNQSIRLLMPASVEELEVQESAALSQARNNRSEIVEFERLRLEADEAVARARGSAGGATLRGNFGLSSRGEYMGELYQQPENYQSVRLSFQMPILDWGRNKSRIKTAEASKQLVEYTVAQDMINFEEEITTQVRSFRMLIDQVEITKIASDISQRSYNISKNRFMIGKISITDLNDALERKDAARRRYIQSLNDYWTAYYELRSLTLYDFKTNRSLLLSDE